MRKLTKPTRKCWICSAEFASIHITARLTPRLLLSLGRGEEVALQLLLPLGPPELQAM